MASQLIGLESFRDCSSFVGDESRTDHGSSSSLLINHLPKVNINVEIIQPTTLTRNDAALAFIPKDGITLWKRLLITLRTKGVQNALELLAETNFTISSFNKITYGLFSLWKSLKMIQHCIVPHCQVSSATNTTAIFSCTRDWQTSPTRYIAWHPHCNKLAVATREDVVLVYTGPALNPVVVRHSSQRDVSSLAWRPLCSAQLAVGCALGVAIWTVDPASLGTRPSASCLTQLLHNTSVNSLCWDPSGKYLASGCAKDSSLYIWNVENREATLLQKFGGGGFTFLSWSPSGDRLLAATPGSVFKIWESRTWSANNWDVMEGHVQSAVWSPCGTKVIFADSVQSTLYSLSVEPVPPLGEKNPHFLKNSSSKVAGVVADFAEMQDLTEDVRFGGLIQDLAWDPRGERLAVLFRSTDFIALFRTRYSPTLNLFPCGVLRGQPDEVPSTMQFRPIFEDGALLTVAWSSGRVQHVSFTFMAQNFES